MLVSQMTSAEYLQFLESEPARQERVLASYRADTSAANRIQRMTANHEELHLRAKCELSRVEDLIDLPEASFSTGVVEQVLEILVGLSDFFSKMSGEELGEDARKALDEYSQELDKLLENPMIRLYQQEEQIYLDYLMNWYKDEWYRYENEPEWIDYQMGWDTEDEEEYCA